MAVESAPPSSPSHFQKFIADFPENKTVQSFLAPDVVKIRSVALLAITAAMTVKVDATIWFWPVIVLGCMPIAFMFIRNYLMKDPLVEACYEIAGGKTEYDNLPEITWKEADWKTAWEIPNATELLSRFNLPDGRKGLLIQRSVYSENKNTTSKHMICLIEKCSAWDVFSTNPKAARELSLQEAFNLLLWDNKWHSYSQDPESSKPKDPDIIQTLHTERWKTVHSCIVTKELLSWADNP